MTMGERIPVTETRGGENPGDWVTDVTLPDWQGAVQHTWTEGCDGFHPPGPCPDGSE